MVQVRTLGTVMTIAALAYAACGGGSSSSPPSSSTPTTPTTPPTPSAPPPSAPPLSNARRPLRPEPAAPMLLLPPLLPYDDAAHAAAAAPPVAVNPDGDDPLPLCWRPDDGGDGMWKPRGRPSGTGSDDCDSDDSGRLSTTPVRDNGMDPADNTVRGATAGRRLCCCCCCCCWWW